MDFASNLEWNAFVVCPGSVKWKITACKKLDTLSKLDQPLHNDVSAESESVSFDLEDEKPCVVPKTKSMPEFSKNCTLKVVCVRACACVSVGMCLYIALC